MARILVIDDDTVLAEMIGIVLTGEHYDVAYCTSGDRALAAYRGQRPDLVLLDLMLPGVDGIEVCRRLRLESGVPIVMLTAKSETADIVSGLEAGA
ncbi:MAG: response regulator, partial [Bifidobacteriaceae bacterium]|nr:response regulator [Bifidobacteriaceae bacterium]